jgi:hypothetical protein
VSDEFIYPEGINADALKKLFEEAYMEVSVDTDGDLIVKDNYRCYLRPDQDGRLISIYAIFGANADAPGRQAGVHQPRQRPGQADPRVGFGQRQVLLRLLPLGRGRDLEARRS